MHGTSHCLVNGFVLPTDECTHAVVNKMNAFCSTCYYIALHYFCMCGSTHRAMSSRAALDRHLWYPSPHPCTSTGRPCTIWEPSPPPWLTLIVENGCSLDPLALAIWIHGSYALIFSKYPCPTITITGIVQYTKKKWPEARKWEFMAGKNYNGNGETVLHV